MIKIIRIVCIILALIVIFWVGATLHSASAEAPSVRMFVPEEIVSDPVRLYAFNKVYEIFGAGQWEAFNAVVMRESSWNNLAVNKVSGACGIAQSLPCKKMGLEDWTDPYGQISWMVDYVESRYKSPKNALAWHKAHGWY